MDTDISGNNAVIMMSIGLNGLCGFFVIQLLYFSCTAYLN